MKDTVTAKGIKCEIIKTEKGLPEFKVIDYTDPENVIFRYEKGDIIKPDIVNDYYALLLLDTEGEEANEWKNHYATNFIMYKKICSFDRMSYTTLKETREALNKDLIDADNND